MTQAIDTLADLAGDYDAIVFDQWGVLHNGETAYPGAIACLTDLQARGVPMAVLSNSGKRAAPNADRITQMGFGAGLFEIVMSSGEALWRDIHANSLSERRFFPIERSPGDAQTWGHGLNISFTGDPTDAEAVLLMGLPDGDTLDDWSATLDQCRAQDLPLFCTNPDKASPRGHGYVPSPGVLAFDYMGQGGSVRFYGKPHRPIFQSLQDHLGTSNLLMVGDSLEHDIAGASGAGWDSLLIQGGLYAPDFATGPADAVLARLVNTYGTAAPTYQMDLLA